MSKPVAPPPEPQPYTAGPAVPMLAVRVKGNWALLAYIQLRAVIRLGRQIVAYFGDYEVRLSVQQGVEWSVDDLMRDFQQHRILELAHHDEKGLTLTVVRIVQGEDGPEEKPVI